jgi:hypothetical protein
MAAAQDTVQVEETPERRRRRRSRPRGPRPRDRGWLCDHRCLRVRRQPGPPPLPRLVLPRAAPEQQAATEEEEKKTGQQALLASIGEQLASLVAQPLMRWLSTVPAEVQRDQPKGYGARRGLKPLKKLEEPSSPHVD